MRLKSISSSPRYFFSVAQQPKLGLGRLIVVISRSHTFRHTQPAALLWGSDQLVAGPLPTQHTTGDTIILSAGFELAIPATKRVETKFVRPLAMYIPNIICRFWPTVNCRTLVCTFTRQFRIVQFLLFKDTKEIVRFILCEAKGIMQFLLFRGAGGIHIFLCVKVPRSNWVFLCKGTKRIVQLLLCKRTEQVVRFL